MRGLDEGWGAGLLGLRGRTIGAKKDDYSLDGKTATRNEVFNLLESCGFTKPKT